MPENPYQSPAAELLPLTPPSQRARLWFGLAVLDLLAGLAIFQFFGHQLGEPLYSMIWVMFIVALYGFAIRGHWLAAQQEADSASQI